MSACEDVLFNYIAVVRKKKKKENPFGAMTL